MTKVHCCICFQDQVWSAEVHNWIEAGTPVELPPLCEEHAAQWRALAAWDEDNED